MRTLVRLAVIIVIVKAGVYVGFFHADRVDFDVVFIVALSALERTYREKPEPKPAEPGAARRIA